MKRSNALRASPLAAIALAGIPMAGAAVIDDPASGGRSGFTWEQEGSISRIEDLGLDDGVSGEAGTTAWSLTVNAPGFLDVTVGNVYNRPPTQFDLVLDGVTVPWTTSMITAEVISRDDQGNPIEFIHYFNGALVDHRLDADVHLLTLVPSLSNTDGNAGTITFGGVTPVPGPLAGSCMLAALLSVAPWLRRGRAGPGVARRWELGARRRGSSRQEATAGTSRSPIIRMDASGRA